MITLIIKTKNSSIAQGTLATELAGIPHQDIISAVSSLHEQDIIMQIEYSAYNMQVCQDWFLSDNNESAPYHQGSLLWYG